MSQFFETIKYKDGEFFLLDYHSERLNRTRFDIFGLKKELKIKDILTDPPKEIGLFRCRLSYGAGQPKATYFPYTISVHQKLSLIEDSRMEYDYKSEERSLINNAVLQSEGDDVIFTQNGLLADSSYANLAFYDGKKWFTPTTYLLKGIKRQFLLDQGLLSETIIGIKDIPKYKKIAFINAMRDFEKVYTFKLEGHLIQLTCEE